MVNGIRDTEKIENSIQDTKKKQLMVSRIPIK